LTNCAKTHAAACAKVANEIDPPTCEHSTVEVDFTAGELNPAEDDPTVRELNTGEVDSGTINLAPVKHRPTTRLSYPDS
jgi:hypothetical protein